MMSDIENDESNDASDSQPLTQEDISTIDLDAWLCERFGPYHQPKRGSYVKKESIAYYDHVATLDKQDWLRQVVSQKWRSSFDKEMLLVCAYKLVILLELTVA